MYGIENLNWFDFVLMAIILLSIIISFFRGFLREAISLVTWVAGVVVALKFAPRVASLLEGTVNAGTLRYMIAFLALFLGVFILGFIVNIIVKRAVDFSGLSMVDRGLGVLFGSARGLVAVAVVLMFTSVTPMQNAKWASESQLAPKFTPLVVWLDGFMPEQIRNVSQWVTNKKPQETPAETADQANVMVSENKEKGN